MKIIDIPVSKVAPCPRNYRQEMDEEELQALTQSVKLHGVKTPVKVRKNRTWKVAKRPLAQGSGFWIEAELPGQNIGAVFTKHRTEAQAKAALPEWELIVGHRRLAAAKAAGLKTIPCIVQELDDKQVLEEQLIENGQRENPPVLDLAEGYERLLKEHKLKVEELARRQGRSVSSVRNMLKLLRLPVTARVAVRKGQMSASVAALIARLPSEAAMNQVTNYACDFNGRGAAASVLDVKQYIAREHRVELKMCPFPQDRPDVAPNTPSCKDCPKRVGNLAKDDPEAYEGIRVDTCTDPACYRQKLSYWSRQVLIDKRKEGYRTLEPEISRSFFDALGGLAVNCRYYLAAPLDCIHALLHPKKGALEVLRAEIGKNVSVFTVRGHGELVELLDQDLVDTFLEARGLYYPETGPIAARKQGSNGAAFDARVEEKSLQRRLAQQAIKQATTVAAQWVKGLDSFPAPLTQLLRALMQHLLPDGHAAIAKFVAGAYAEEAGLGPRAMLKVSDTMRGGDATALFILIAQTLAAAQCLSKEQTTDPGMYEKTFGWSFAREMTKLKEANGKHEGKEVANA